MGRVWRIGFLALAFLVACNGNKQAPEPEVAEHGRSIEGPSLELSAIDSLLWRQPDSALTCLLPYFDTCKDTQFSVSTATAYDQHYAHLLLAELLYKNDYAQTNRPALRRAVAYFDSLTFTLNDHSSLRRLIAGGAPLSPTRNDQLFFLSARAHYINGVGYYEHDSVVDACKEYMKALKVMEERFEEQELTWQKIDFLAFINTRLTELFSNLYLHEQAIHFSKESLRYYEKHNVSSNHIVWTLNEIGSNYDMLEQLDSADYYYSKAIQVLNDTSTLLYRIIASHQAYLEYKKDHFMADIAISCLYDLLSKAESDKERITLYSYLGEILFHEKQLDSSYMFLIDVFQQSSNKGSKKHAAERLVEICKVQHKDFEILEYANFLVPFANQEENKSEIKSQLTELYKKYGQLRLERVHQQEKMRSLSRTMIIVGSLLVLMLFITILYHKNKKKKQHLETQIAAERHSHQIQQDALSGRLKQKSQEVRELQEQIKQQNDKDAAVEPTISFAEEPICRLIMERVKEGQFKSQMDCSIYKDFALSKEQLMALHGAANRHFNHFTERLAQAYPDLTKSDLDYCCLYLLGLTDADIAALMQRAYSTVSDRSRKLKTVFGSNSPLSITLHRLANQETTI